MDESSIYKVITLKELIAQVYTKETGFPSKACISLAKFFYCRALHPDTKPEKDGPKSAFADCFLDAHNYFISLLQNKHKLLIWTIAILLH